MIIKASLAIDWAHTRQGPESTGLRKTAYSCVFQFRITVSVSSSVKANKNPCIAIGRSEVSTRARHSKCGEGSEAVDTIANTSTTMEL